MKGKMRHDLYAELYQIEDHHWWHQHKRLVVKQFIDKFAKKGKALDVGAGTGKMLAELSDDGWDTLGLDGERNAVKWSHRRGMVVKQIDLETDKFPFPDNYFEAVLALDVLEHLRNESFVLTEIRRVLKPKGIVIITVPAYQWLFNYWDKMLGHQRRYSINNFKRKIKEHTFQVVYISYFCALFLPPAILVRLFKQLFGEKRKAVSDFQTTPLAP